MHKFTWCFSVNDFVYFPLLLVGHYRIKEDSPTCGLAPHPSSSAAAKRTAHLFRDLEQHFLHHQSQFAGKLQRLHICMTVRNDFCLKYDCRQILH